MAENRIFNIPVSFPIEELMESLVMSYSGKGYSVQENKLGNTSVITISKNVGGIHTITGLGEQIKIMFTYSNGKLVCSTSEEQWSDKIVGFIVGWFCIWIPWITTGVGIYKQISLKKDVFNHINMFIMGKSE